MPIPIYISFSSATFNSFNILGILLSTSSRFNFFLFTSLTNNSLPLLKLISLSTLEKYALILFLAPLVLAKSSHSNEGDASFFVLILTISPSFKVVDNGTITSLTTTPTIVSPILVCTLYAKSTPVDPFGNSNTSPLGVYTYMLSPKTSSFTVLTKSSAFELVSLNSIMFLNNCSFCSIEDCSFFPFSL